MKPNFTKGPWNIVEDENSHEYFTEKVFAIYHEDKEGLEFICDTGKVESETAKANAHLISAAPDMYALLQELLECHGVIREYRDDVKKVLDKASGGDVEFTFEGE